MTTLFTNGVFNTNSLYKLYVQDDAGKKFFIKIKAAAAWAAKHEAIALGYKVLDVS